MPSFLIAAANFSGASVRLLPGDARDAPAGPGLDITKPRVRLGHDDAKTARRRSARKPIRLDQHDVQAAGGQHVRRHRSGQSAANDHRVGRMLAAQFRKRSHVGSCAQPSTWLRNLA